MRYAPDFVTAEEEREIMRWVDAQEWEKDLSRRRQFHGGSYEGQEGPRKPLPPILSRLARRVFDEGFVTQVPDRCLINEYFPGQGIAAHVDYDRFSDEVVMISLLDMYPMRFRHLTQNQVYEKFLERRSICVLSGESRWEWTHEIVKRKFDIVPGGGKRPRHRRVSVTFRRIHENALRS